MKALWGGRFKKGMHPLLKCFSYSLAVDYELLFAELKIDEAWAKMLGHCGLITAKESRRLAAGVRAVAKELAPKDEHAGPEMKWLREYEDVHTLIQAALERKIGPVARKIHTGRSRNDLVVASTRLYLKGRLQGLDEKIRMAQAGLLDLAGRAYPHVIAGMTHLKKAQPVLISHHLLAYVEMLEEDRARMRDAASRADLLVLGSAALAGSSLPIDQKYLARELGFSKIAANSMAAVSDRAFLAEALSAIAILWTHLSRLAEDFILWNCEAFGYLELDDAFATGSSLMPQKKNPDIFELIRGRSAVILGELQSLLVLQKGLPLAYNRDLQEDKPGFFDALRKTSLALELLALTFKSASFNPEAMRASVEDDNLYATDILEYLVRKKVPFSVAHETVGRVVRHALEEGKRMRELDLGEWKTFSPVFQRDICGIFDPVISVSAKQTIASTHLARVLAQIQRWQKKLGLKKTFKG